MLRVERRSPRAIRRVMRAVAESLECRRLLSTDPLAYANQVQSLPFALDFTHPVNGLLDASGQSIGFTRVQLNRNGDQYQPSLIRLNATGSELDLTTRGTDTSGSNYGTDNTLVNALETEFDATTRGFTITTRLKGPLTQLAAPYDSGAVYFGPDDDNYVKLAAGYAPGLGATLQFTDEQTATTHTVNVLQSLGSFASINTLDLRLTGDAAAGTVAASYSINGGTYISLAGVVTLADPEKSLFFNSAGRAGIFAATRNGLPPITLAFGCFEIDPGAPVTAAQQASVAVAHPADGDVSVPRDTPISIDFRLPNGGIDNSTLYVTNPPALLLRASDHTQIPAIVNTSGGGDAIVLQPQAPLDPNTTYTFVLTGSLKDVAGIPFKPFAMTFTTGTTGGTTDPTLAFQKVSLPTAQNAPFTCVRVGPDHLLYATTLDGRIFRWTINPDGTLGSPQVITTLAGRLITGFAFDPRFLQNPSNPILWVSNGFYSGNDVYYQDNAPDFSGQISVLSGANLQSAQVAVFDLPRSIRDHLTEQPTFGPDGALYFAQGSNTSYGAPDVIWGNRSEHLLTAAVLRLDASKIDLAHPLDAKTIDAGGNYDPFAPGAPLTIYASGVRNAFELLWAKDGTLFAPTNGSSAGGNTPAYPDAVSGVRIDQANGPYTGPNVPAIQGVAEAEDDWLFEIKQGGYYGHPNPARDEYVLNGGRPTATLTDPSQVPDYPVGVQPDRNYRGYSFDFGQHRSPDGIVEYQGNAFGGALNGKLLISEYSAGDDIAILTRDANDNITSIERGVAGLTGFSNPVNLCEDKITGFLYVAELGGQKITLLRPVPPGATIAVSKSLMVFNAAEVGSPGAAPSPAQTLTVTNNGTAPLTFPADGFTIVDDPSNPGSAANFAILNRATIPASIQPGQSIQVQIDYTATAVAIQSAILQIKSNDANQPITNITLHGIGTPGQFGTNEPSLVRVLRAYDIPTIVGAGPNDINEANPTYPEMPDPSSQEVPMQRLVKAGSGPVTITPLASFNASAQPTVRFGYYTPGDPTDQTELFTIGQADAQTVNPNLLGATSFDPGSSTFGLYAVFPGISTGTGQPDIHYSEDAFNKALDPNFPRKFRFFPLENPDKSVVPNAFVVASEDFNNPQFNSFVNFVGIIRNVKPAPDAVGAPVLGLQNLDQIPSSTRMVFNRIQNVNPLDPAGFKDTVHDTATLQIHNSGDVPLIINALILSDTTNWQLVNPPAAGTAVAPGGTLNLTIKFIAQSVPPNLPFNETNDTATTDGTPVLQAGGVWSGTLTISSNDPVNPTRTVQLEGYWQKVSEHEMEPGTQVLTNLMLGYGTIISNDQRPNYNNNGTTAVIYGEEVNSAYWQAADPSLPVTVFQYEDWSSQFDLTQAPPVPTASRTYWYPQGQSGNLQHLFTRAVGDAQTLFPAPSGSPGSLMIASFTPNGAFGLNVDGEASDASLNLGNSFVQQNQRSGHQFRFYPLRDSSGNLVPNTWLAYFDYAFSSYENYDYQDLGFIVTNMRPANAPPAPADLFAVAAATGGVSLQWAPVAYPNAGYNIYRAASPSGPFIRLNTAPLTQPSYLHASAPAGVASYYRVTAVDLANGTESQAADASATASAPQQQGAPLTSLDIGATPAGSTTVIADGTDYDVTAGGPSIYGTADGFRFLYKQQTGDFDVKVRVVSITIAGAIDQAGLMARASLDASSPEVSVTASPSEGFRFKDRDTAGGITNTLTDSAATPYPNVWLRLVRSGSVFTGYYSTDGVNWTVAGAATVPMADPIYLGLAAAANVATATITAQFRSFQATALPAPVTSLTATAPDSGHAALSWSPAGGATGYVVQRKGPGDADFVTIAQNVVGTSYTDASVQGGTSYAYRILAASAAGASMAYTPTASAAVPIPGDIDRDGKVDFADLVILARNFGKSGLTWDQGDLNGDGKVDFNDLVILARHYGAAV